MELKRGWIVAAAGPGEYSRKPRPFLVVQSDAFNAVHASVTLCPITSEVAAPSFFRLRIEPSALNGLTGSSDIQIDKVQSLRRDRIRSRIGELDDTGMSRVDEALRIWLEL